MNLDLSQPETCTLRDIVQDALESAEETLSEMESDGEDADQIVNQRAYIEEVGGIRDKLDALLKEKV